MEINSVPLKGKEYLYTYRNSQQISSQTGLIGYVRADMGALGTEFFSTWNGFRDDQNTQDFKDDIDTVINSLRKDGGFLSNRDQLEDFCINSDNVFAYNTGVDYGVRVNTKEYAFLMRLNPYKGNYNLYCYCYKKGWLDSHLEKAEKGIRFIDSHYNEKFRIEDGDEIIIKSTEEKDTVRDAPAKELAISLFLSVRPCPINAMFSYNPKTRLALSIRAKWDIPIQNQVTADQVKIADLLTR